jgi:hypothetical protein
MFNRRAAAALVLTIAASGCGNNPPVPFVGPPATSSPTPTATPVGATPTPTPIGATPTPTPTATPFGATPTPTPTATPIGATPTPTPTATPIGATPTPTPTATPAAVVPNPSALTFSATGATSAQQLTVAQTGFVGTFAQTNTCAAVASVSPAGAPAATPVFTVTPNAAGTCSITITGGSGQTVIVSVAVTTSGLVVSSRRIRP